MIANSAIRVVLADIDTANGHVFTQSLQRSRAIDCNSIVGGLRTYVPSLAHAWQSLNALKGLTIMFAFAASLTCASADEPCWRPGLSRNIGIAEQSCPSSRAGKAGPQKQKIDPIGHHSQRRPAVNFGHTGGLRDR
jgi:hypothetical protein